MLLANTYVRDRSQRSGYTRIYRVVKPGNTQSLVQFVGDWINGRWANMSRGREETYRDNSNLVEHKD